MRFVLIGHDGTDAEAPARRAATRPAHLEVTKPLLESGIFKYGGPLLDKDENMVGSMMVLEYDSEEQLRAEYLAIEPYVAAGVWQKIEIYPFKTAPAFEQA